MNKLNNAVDRFCILHPRFGVRNLMLYIAVANVAVYLLDRFASGGITLSSLLCFDPALVLRLQLWRIVTFVMIPEGGSAIGVLISAYFYYWIGTTLERQWGTAKFTCYYIGGMALTMLGASLVSAMVGVSVPVYGAGYVNFAMFLAFAMLWPDAQVLLFFIIPIKIKYLAYVDLAFFAYSIIRYVVLGAWFFSIIPLMALLNFVIFFWPELLRFFHIEQSHAAKAHHARAAASNMKREAQQANAGLRKCAVCGRTNLTNPELEFRYCSRCAGYHCFCSDHLFSHVHFTEDQP
ncbi:MAG: rhomboid family intramembrane serine protease [Oscillospiraceae bacterium]|nr:rhomboid family intramembrane serine protease [Oscillospiraceae bacterium]